MTRPLADKASPILYCVEGHWNEPGDPSLEPSVEPLLQMLHRLGLWNYVRRNAATNDELFYWLKNEWDHCPYGSILYFATHGGPGEIWLSNAEEPSSVVAIEQLLANGIDADAASFTSVAVQFSTAKRIASRTSRRSAGHTPFLDTARMLGGQLGGLQPPYLT